MALLLLTAACAGEGPEAEPAPARYVGVTTCAGCHPDEAARWRGSDHDRAMEAPSDASVEGRFDGGRLEHHGTTARFFQRDGTFFVHTEGPEGRPDDFPVAYTFGVRPLQQYLVRLPGGRLQALPFAWDARSPQQGGQRWFHLYPSEPIPHTDELHWTRRRQNWNFMCAECHSTGLRKGYVPEEDRYETTWAELDVACEACHGPGSRHAEQAQAASGRAPAEVALRPEPLPARWDIDPGTGNAVRSPPLPERTEIEICGRCHSRRSVTSEEYVHGRPLLDTHRVTLLEPGRYYPDGQIQDEVYVYGSFLQSRMYASGVRCSDCHDPHSLEPLAGGNALCNRCHLATKYDAPEHHHHDPEGPGAQCVECHMPSRLYMVVDARRDHSLRVPRPDLSLDLGTPNACNGCHSDRSVEWAASAAARWWPGGPGSTLHYGPVLAAGRLGLPEARDAVAALLADAEQPGIVRATAASLLRVLPATGNGAALGSAAVDPDPLVRLGALYGADGLAPPDKARLALPLLHDPIRTLRVEATRLVASLPRTMLSPAQREALAAGVVEYRAAQRVNADRAESYLNLGVLALQLGEPDEAERTYRAGLRLEPDFVPLYVNLADLHRMRSDDRAAEQVLRDGLEIAPASAELRHALGLTLVRRQRLPEALPELQRAAEQRPERPDYAYVYGVALEAAGQPGRALEVLTAAQRRHPGDRELLVALATISHQAGRSREAVEWARRLVALAPDDPAARRLLQQLGGQP